MLERRRPVRVTKRSIITGFIRTMDIPVTLDQMADWNAGAFIQDAAPQLDADQREFLISGITPNEWDAFISEPDEAEVAQ